MNKTKVPKSNLCQKCKIVKSITEFRHYSKNICTPCLRMWERAYYAKLCIKDAIRLMKMACFWCEETNEDRGLDRKDNSNLKIKREREL